MTPDSAAIWSTCSSRAAHVRAATRHPLTAALPDIVDVARVDLGDPDTRQRPGVDVPAPDRVHVQRSHGGDTIRSHNTVYAPHGTGRTALIHPRDITAAAAVVLTTAGTTTRPTH